MDFHSRLKSLAVLIFILSTCLSTSLAKQHPVRHAHSRHKRQYGHPSDFEPSSYMVDGPGGPEYGNWGPWTASSECSRTCGGGVAYQTRQCRDISPDGRYLCSGGSKRYFSCNIQNCPTDSDFRSEQCAEYNRVPFEDRYYDWVPYTKAPNACELNCMPRGERFYYRHNRKVIDGTRCDDEKLDVCVDGQCLPVGCDMLIGSPAREDKCRECGGDGSSCNTVEGLLDNNDLQVGYNDILLIPAGATNIKVKEIQPTNNYLAVRNTAGHYYLNGNWRIDFPRKLKFVGTTFHYERKPHGFYAPESIMALGPTTEPIYISLLYQEPNPGIMYEYSIPKGISPHSLTDNYTWVEGEFTPCSMTCGGGTQQRSVICVRRRDMVQVPENLCNANYMPTSMQSCSPEPCPPAWNAGPWSQCSESCARGIQERQVYCMQIVANGLPSVADESECENAGEKPPHKQECNVDAICPTWHVGPWKPCDKLCGDGFERRDVKCYRKTEGKIEVLDDSACPEEKPESEKPCMLRPCEGVDWITSEWSGCDEKCGLTQETRTARCVTQTGVVFPDSFCHKYRKPELVRQCESSKKCQNQWYATQWSECSSKCGTGVQTRKVFCGEINDEGLIKKVEDDKCEAAEKYETEKDCVGEEKCKGDWFSGPWSPCSKECGGGQKTRKVLCVQDNNTVSITNCDGNTIPFSSESCNDHSCGEDEVYTVEPTHDLSEDDEEDCEYDEDYEEDYEDGEEGQTTPMKSTSELSTSSDLSGTESTELSMSSDLSSLSSDMSSLTTSSDLSSSDGSTESSLSTEISSTVSLSSLGTDSTLSSSSMNSSNSGSTESSSSDGSTENSSSSSSFSTDCSSIGSTESSSEGSTSESSSTESSSPHSTESTESTDSSSTESTESTESSSSQSTESTESTESSSTQSTESTESTESSSSQSTESTESTESSSTQSTESTESTESSSTQSTESTESTESSSTQSTESTESTESSSTQSTESTESTESSSTQSTESTESTESSSTQSTESTESTESSSTQSTESTESTESSSTQSTESTESTESSSTQSTESTESTESSSTQSTESTESTESSSTQSTESTESTESSSTQSTESTESTESSSTQSTESTESTESSSTQSTESTESTESSSTQSTESTESTESSSTQSTESTESTESSSTQSTESTESTESSSTQSTESTESTESSSTQSTESTESTESSSTQSTESTESTESSSTQSTESTESTESSSTQSTESTESTESSSTQSTESTESTESSSTQSTESTESTEATSASDSTTEISTSTTLRGIGEVDVDEDTSSSQSTESTSSSSTGSTESTSISSSESTESSSTESTESTESTDSTMSTESTETTESTESTASGSTDSTESTVSGSTESTESTESTVSGSTESTESTVSGSTESTESTESTVSGSTESTESTESTVSGSTESTESTVSGSTESTESTESTASGSTESTESTESTVSGSTESTESTESTLSGSTESTETTVSGSTESTHLSSKWATTSIEELWGPSMTSIQMAITKEQKLKKCKPKKRPKCRKSEFGCCSDGKTPAEGPFGKGCPQPETCEESEFGCCPDGVSPAKGKGEKGCPKFDCNETLFGCCPDKVSVAQGNDFEGCPEEMLPAECSTTQFGCCPDNMTVATGPNFKGCFVCEGSGECESCNNTVYGCCPDNIRAATGPNFQGCEEGSGEVDCANTTYGCCPDGIISAEGPNFENCGVIDSENCTLSYFGCCPDGVTPALGSRYEGCRMPCESEPFGCCEDNFTPAHGPNREGCCLNSVFGCCPDNILYARGPNFEGCGCQYSPYGCCPDNQTAARGYNSEGCGCQYTPHGCCPDNYTPAPAPGYQGCPCYTFQFGCCPDGVTVAKGPQSLGCGCENTEFGCCSDGKTPASGPEKAGCGCEASEFGCCPDGVEEALGEDFDGCRKQLPRLGDICKLPKDRGSCRDFTVKWFYDMEYGGCSRFWYGGCEGNDNRFKTPEECKETCIAPEGKERCYLPKVEGPCEKYFPKWYYDTERKQCGQFIYGGCLGNTNNFDTREECQELCAPEQTEDVCEQPVEEGPCEGNFPRWYFDKDRKSCFEFRYGGCKANANNFLTESACKERCLQPGRSKVAEICQPKKDPGPCLGSVLRWYYDDKLGTCRQFFYGGCLGNSNRFKTEVECKQKCQIFDPEKDHCSLPREPGNCNEKIPRWYFDNSENRCMPFYYTGCEGNANRFETREACENDCPPRVYKDLCQLPALIGECYNYTERWYYDAQAGRCSPFYYGGCGGNQNNFELLTDCQRRCEGYIPEERIDIPTQRPVTQEPEHFRTEYCFYGSDAGPCRPSESIPQWFYDRADGVCKQFLYGGCDGNRNRFGTREECEHYCGNAQDICILPKTVGPCNGNYAQWYYDRQTDNCYEFDYGGCQGNGNRFNTKYDCEIRCRQGPVEPPTPPPTAVVPTTPPPRPVDPTDICYAPADPGPCLEEQASWYYEARTGRCQAFVYGGCLGNANRFDSEEQCERQCGQFKGQDVCNLPYDVGPCRGSFQKWFYDVDYRVCREFTYSGCGGNSNRFSSLQECETLCFHREEAIPVTNDTALPHQAICRLPVEVGPCQDVQYKRWHYDESRKTCVPFIYSGCGGNFNRFKNFDTCIKFCVAPLRDVAPPPLIEDPNEIIVQAPEYCEEEQRKCSLLHCPYGIEKFVDSQDCERCRCTNPCREVYCPEGTRCAVDLYQEEPGRVSARGICRAENKPGQCPNLATGSGSCTAECQSDADCPGPQKCCTTNCHNMPMTSCVYPVEPVFPITTRPPPTQIPFYGAQPPTVIAEEPYVSAPEGNYATLKCVVRGIPTPVVSWRKGSDLIDGTGGRHRFLSDGSLQIIGLYSSDAGVYYCSADNGVGHPVQREFRLDVTDPVQRPAEVIGEDNTYVVVTLGTPAILQCYAIGWPRPGVTWWRGDRMLPLSSGQYEQRRDFSLLVKSITLRNLGPYVCQAYNGLGKAASGTVTVQALGPVYSSNPEDEIYTQYVLNEPLSPEGPSRPWLTYRPRLTYTPSYETTHPQSRATTHPPTYRTEPTTQETPRVFIVPVAVNITLDQTSFQVGSDISIPCIVDGYPVPRVTWYKDNEMVQPSRKIEITESNRLRIIRADGSDSGTYRCVAQNQYGEASSHVTIEVSGIYIHPNCTDNIFFANCELIVKAKHCQHKYYARFCCRSCTMAGQLPSHGTHLDDMRQTGSSN